MATNTIELHKEINLDDSILGHQKLEVAVNPYNRIDVINDIEDFFALREQWTEINENSPNGNVFSSWEWMYTWWETYLKQGKRNLYILKCTNIYNDLLGIAPFQIISNPKKYFPCNRQLVLIATGETDGTSVFGEYTDLVIKKGHETAVISAISDHLTQQKNLWDGIKFNQQLKGSHLSKLFESGIYSNNSINKTVSEYGFRTYIDLPETYKEYLMSLKKKKRNNITRIFSRLESEQEFSFLEVTTESEIKAQIAGKMSAIDILADLNKVRRGDLEKTSAFEAPNFVLFHRRLLKRLIPLNKVSLNIMHFGDNPVAALYSYKDNETVHAYQSGFETENGHRYSLLTTMLTQEISKSIDDEDLSRFNFMYADEESTYKRRYSGTTEQMYNISYDKSGLKQTIYNVIHKQIKEVVKNVLKIN